MNDIKLESVDLNPNYVVALKKASITTAAQLVTSPVNQLVKSTGLALVDIQRILLAVSHSLVPNEPLSAFSIKCKQQSDPWQLNLLTTGCMILDSHLIKYGSKAGIPLKGITEIAGESGTGKTQLCLVMSLTCQLSVPNGGLGGGVVYICTECAFPSKRLKQLEDEIHKKNPNCSSTRVFIKHIADIESLKTCLSSPFENFISSHNIKLLVIDSIAAVFRGDLSEHTQMEKGKEIQAIGHIIHGLLYHTGIKILVANQVSDVADPNDRRQSIPALGLAWANFVTSRIILKQNRNVAIHPNFPRKREIYVRFSPFCPAGKLSNFVIKSSGLCGVVDNTKDHHCS